MGIEEFWNTDTWTINHLYKNEMKIIEEEQKQAEDMEKGNKHSTDTREDSEEAVDVYEELFVDD